MNLLQSPNFIKHKIMSNLKNMYWPKQFIFNEMSLRLTICKGLMFDVIENYI